MKKLKEFLNSFTEQDYIDKKVNLHIHTKHSDGKGDEKQILNSAKESGYKIIAITDHNTTKAHENVQDEILLTGVEFDCWFGYVFIHLLAYGIDVNHSAIQPFLAKNKKDTEGVIPRLIAKRDVKKLIEAIHQANGIAVLAHPACYWALSLENLVKKLIKIGLDGIETYYPYPSLRGIIKFHTSEEVLKLVDKFPQLIKTGGTDFHGYKF